MDLNDPMPVPDESTEAQIDRFIAEARSTEEFMATLVQPWLSARSTEDGQPERATSSRSDPPIVYDDQLAAEILVARASPDRPQDLQNIQFRGSPVDVIAYGQWLANILASGILGNAAWDAIKLAVKSYRSRQVDEAHPGLLSADEARAVAYLAMLLNSTLHARGAPLSEPGVELRNYILEHRWEFVYERWGRRWYVGVPHRDPTMSRITVLEKRNRVEPELHRHVSPTRRMRLGRLLRRLRK